MQFCYALRSFGHVNYVCDLRLQYCIKSEKGNLLKGSPETQVFFLALRGSGWTDLKTFQIFLTFIVDEILFHSMEVA